MVESARARRWFVLIAAVLILISARPVQAVCVSGDVTHRLWFYAEATADLDKLVFWDLGPEMFMRVYVNDALTCLPERFDGPSFEGECFFDIPEPYDPVEIKLELMDSDPPLDDYTVDINAGTDKIISFMYDPKCGTFSEITPGDLPGCPAGNHLAECRDVMRTTGSEAFVEFTLRPVGDIPLAQDSLSAQNLEVIQVSPNPTRIIADRPTVVRLDIASSHEEVRGADVTVTARDKAGNTFIDMKTVSVPMCGVERVTFFGPEWEGGPGSGTEAGFRPEDGPLNSFSVQAEIDPASDCDEAMPPCQGLTDCRIVDGQILDLDRALVQARTLNVKYQPFWRRPSAPCSDAYDAALPPIADTAARPFLEDLFPINTYVGGTSTTRMLWPLPSGVGWLDVADLIDPRPGLIQLEVAGAIAGLDRWVLVLHDSDTGDDRGLQCHWPSMDIGNVRGASAGGNSRVVVMEPEQAGVPNGARVAHEIAHTFGASDAGCPLRGDVFGGITCEDEYNYPDRYVVDPGRGVPSNGIRVLRWTGAEPNMDGSACLMGFPTTTSWMGRADYETLLDELTSPTAAEPSLHVRMHLTSDFGGSFYHDAAVPLTVRPTQRFDTSVGRNPVGFTTTLRVLRTDGSTIGTVSFTLETADLDGDGIYEGFGYVHEEDGEALDALDTGLIIPLPPDAQRIELVRRSPGPGGLPVETVTDTLILASPEIFPDLLAPRTSFYARVGEEYEIRWDALPGIESGASTIPTRSYVFLSPDDGASWTPIAAYLPDRSFRWLADVEGRFQVRVFSSSGFAFFDVQGESDPDMDGCGGQFDPQPGVTDPDGADMDGVAQICDLCPDDYDPLQDDDDDDLLGDPCDNCPGDYNPGQENADGDALGDACDCLQQDPGVWAVPGPVSGLMVTESAVSEHHSDLIWTSQVNEAGPSVVYDVISGDVETLRSPNAFLDAVCVAVDAPTSGATVFKLSPAVGKAHWYLVRGDTPCGDGTYDSGDGSQAFGRDDLLDQAQGPCA